jgi:hypothetical protein
MPDGTALLGVLSERTQQLQQLPYFLTNLYERSGKQAVDDHLLHMERTVAAMVQARQDVADFIAERFPLGSATG